MCHLPRIHKLCDDCVGKEDVQMNMTLISTKLFQSTHTAYKTVTYFMCTALVNVMDRKLALFCLKCNASNEQLLITDSFGK